MIQNITVLLYAYLIGSIPTAYLAGQWLKGIDLRQYGSGNVGSSNFSNAVGKQWVIPLGLFELLVKGASPIWIGRFLFDVDPWILVLAASLSIAGHNWSLYLKFNGGRGITPALGILLATAPFTLLPLSLGIVLLGWIVTRSSALWVGIAVLCLPLWAILLKEPWPFWGLPEVRTSHITGLAISFVVLVFLKRILGNSTPQTEGVPRRHILLNRILFDRDIRDRDAWINRTPMGSKN